MKKINVGVAGLAFGSMVIILYILWSLIVFSEQGRAFLDLVFKMHFLHFEYHVEPFVFSHAASLVFICGLIGFFLGCLFALLWNSAYSLVGSK